MVAEHRLPTCCTEASQSSHGSPGGRVCRVLTPGLCEAAVCQVARPGLHVQPAQGCPGLSCLRVQLQRPHQPILLQTPTRHLSHRVSRWSSVCGPLLTMQPLVIASRRVLGRNSALPHHFVDISASGCSGAVRVLFLTSNVAKCDSCPLCIFIRADTAPLLAPSPHNVLRLHHTYTISL